MPLSPEQIRNSIRLVLRDHDPLCCGYCWEIHDQDSLAKLVAWTVQGHFQHAERILNGQSPRTPISPQTFREQAIRSLTLPPHTGDEAKRWHRDGYVFQHIAWIAAQLEAGGTIASSMPHPRAADKGFDAILVPLESDRNAIQGVVICEEKATGNPRREITRKVWPAVASIEAGERDAELNAEITVILRAYHVANIDEVLTEAHWLQRKAYRISITVSPGHDEEEARLGLFEGYDDHAPGEMSRRRAETLALPNMRQWMDDFCAQVVAAL